MHFLYHLLKTSGQSQRPWFGHHYNMLWRIQSCSLGSSLQFPVICTVAGSNVLVLIPFSDPFSLFSILGARDQVKHPHTYKHPLRNTGHVSNAETSLRPWLPCGTSRWHSLRTSITGLCSNLEIFFLICLGRNLLHVPHFYPTDVSSVNWTTRIEETLSWNSSKRGSGIRFCYQLKWFVIDSERAFPSIRK
jgi:hypothetical protein